MPPPLHLIDQRNPEPGVRFRVGGGRSLLKYAAADPAGDLRLAHGDSSCFTILQTAQSGVHEILCAPLGK